ncbi:Asp/Glu racemase [Thalassobius sp. MITS945101]|uniref:maleate cis-trans isomerase family protein n=1 Tax=Thalassobius sp. MITS945101 TaxID=3096994 RepID=UPI00399BFCF8
MDTFPYDLSPALGHRANLGLVVLQTDETIEYEAALLDQPGLARYVTRVPSGAEVTQETLKAMAEDLPRAASLLPPSVSFDVIGYGCTSGSMAIGPDRVAALVSGSADCKAVTNPLTAALAACAALGIRRLGVLTPYIETVSRPLCDAFQSAGIAVTGHLSFGEEEEAKVARIDPASIAAGARNVGQSADCDAVFLSCTNLRCFGIIDDLEAELDKPVLSSNQVLFWHMARLAGLGDLTGPGRLFQQA